LVSNLVNILSSPNTKGMIFIRMLSVGYLSIDWLSLLDYGAVLSMESSLLPYDFPVNREINREYFLINREIIDLTHGNAPISSRTIQAIRSIVIS
jgi:hypothetical protein